MYSLVIPCYNEALNLPRLLTACAAAVGTRTDIEVLVVNNGSRDESAQLLAQLLPQYRFARLVTVEMNQGYGFGILAGLRAAKGEWLGWTHADLQTDPADAVAAFDLIAQGRGEAFYKGKRYGRSLFDLAFTLGMSCFASLALRRRLWDINAQPTIFSHRFFAAWHQPPHDFSLDLYAYALARSSGLPVRRFPVFFGKRVAGTAHLNSLGAKLRYSRRTVHYILTLARKGVR